MEVVLESSMCSTLGTVIGILVLLFDLSSHSHLLYPGYYIQNSPVGSPLCFSSVIVTLSAQVSKCQALTVEQPD